MQNSEGTPLSLYIEQLSEIEETILRYMIVQSTDQFSDEVFQLYGRIKNYAQLHLEAAAYLEGKHEDFRRTKELAAFANNEVLQPFFDELTHSVGKFMSLRPLYFPENEAHYASVIDRFYEPVQQTIGESRWEEMIRRLPDICTDALWVVASLPERDAFRSVLTDSEATFSRRQINLEISSLNRTLFEELDQKNWITWRTHGTNYPFDEVVLVTLLGKFKDRDYISYPKKGLLRSFTEATTSRYLNLAHSPKRRNQELVAQIHRTLDSSRFHRAREILPRIQ